MVYKYRVIHKSVKHGMIYLHMLENWLMPQLNEGSNDYISLPQRRARVSQSKLATKVDRTHRKRR